MQMHRTLRFLFLFLLATTTLSPHASAQTHRKHYRSKRDSLRATIMSRDSLMRSFRSADTSINGLLKKLEDYNSSYNDIKTNLADQLDTVEISRQLPGFERRIKTIGGLINNDKEGTLRYLYVIRSFLTRTDAQLDEQQAQLKAINDKLLQNQSDLSELYKDTTLRIIPTDSALRATFLTQKLALMNKWHKLDSVNRRLFLKIGFLQNRVTGVYLSILDETDQIDLKIKAFANNAFTDADGYIWDMNSTPGSSFKNALSKTVLMNQKLFRYFFERDILIHLAGLLLFIFFLTWIYFNHRKIARNKEIPGEVLNQTHYVVGSPILSALVVTLAIAPNFYDHPPVVFLEAFLIGLAISVLILTKRTQAHCVYKFLNHVLWLTLFYALSNLFIVTSNTDRFVVLILSALAVWVGFKFLSGARTPTTEGLPPFAQAIVQVFICLQAASFLCNVFGRFGLAKIIGVTAVFNLWLAIGLWFLVQIIMEGLFLQLEANKSKHGISSYIDFKLLRDRFRSILSFLAVIVWLIMLTQNLDIEDAADAYIDDLLSVQHKLGSTGAEFSFQSIIIFVAVLWLSSVISRIISYLYDVAGQHELVTLKKKNRTSTLLIRIGVITVGFFLAVAVSHFPLEKLTIIISAFGIGIGFGLQNIVNNLVSGLILAFEKPVQIGDIIEVDNRSGTIKEIGIRSSKIATADGAEVIIPNGDLISHHVINWTLSNNNRRVELIIGVAYGTDIDKVKGLLKNILSSRNDIMKQPEPLIFVHNLSESSVDFRILFWAADIAQWLELKSLVLSDIYSTFNKEGIDIPYPTHDVNLKLPDGTKISVGDDSGRSDTTPPGQQA